MAVLLFQKGTLSQALQAKHNVRSGHTPACLSAHLLIRSSLAVSSSLSLLLLDVMRVLRLDVLKAEGVLRVTGLPGNVSAVKEAIADVRHMTPLLNQHYKPSASMIHSTVNINHQQVMEFDRCSVCGWLVWQLDVGCESVPIDAKLVPAVVGKGGSNFRKARRTPAQGHHRRRTSKSRMWSRS